MVHKKLEILMGRHLNPDPASQIAYGTAGFRTKADRLDHVMFRMGILAAMRAVKTEAVIGVMITASHNPACDNGVKLVDPMGEMLEASWEALATKLANAANEDLGTEIDAICAAQGIDIKRLSTSRIAIARDTRPSSLPLAQSARDGADAFSAQVLDFGLLTTPQLHYVVRCLNTNGTYGLPNEEGYYTKIASAFNQLKGSLKASVNGATTGDGDTRNYVPSVTFDGANGIGALKVKNLLPHLKGSGLEVLVVNDGTKPTDVLNQGCGADFVKTTQSPPGGVVPSPGRRFLALDGDADRIVYFYFEDGGKFKLLDGDKISSLAAKFLQDLIREAGLDSLEVGVVQTAYANGSSTLYMKSQLGLPVACVPTGVKHLHHRAGQFDVGVYFEANGHGTVVFSENAASKILAKSQDASVTEVQRSAAKRLQLVMDMINQTVGDAFSDMLLVETALEHYGWDCPEWNATYTDFPNRLKKCQVPDRNAVQTADAERKVTSPPTLQPRIDALLASFGPAARAFVRPSGTEDVVRVYAETPKSQEDADALADAVVNAVKEEFDCSPPKNLWGVC